MEAAAAGRKVELSSSHQLNKLFAKLVSANTVKSIVSTIKSILYLSNLRPSPIYYFYPKIKDKLTKCWKAAELWKKIDKRLSCKLYNHGTACAATRVLIVGAGPCGLRTAIEAQLLGAKVVIIEKRDKCTRNNVLHLWRFVISDLREILGAKIFYGKFCPGQINHISIRQLQFLLLKLALLIGVEFYEGVGFEGLIEPPSEETGWRARVSPNGHPVNMYEFDVVIRADGKRNNLVNFPKKTLKCSLAIAITANYLIKKHESHANAKEISGINKVFNQKFFNEMCIKTGIDLENIVYYKDETHYFVMTPKKQSLLSKGVLINDYSDTAKLLSKENVSQEHLRAYAMEAAHYATENKLEDLEFAINGHAEPDVAVFDFNTICAAENSCHVLVRKGHKLLQALVGDCLLEPFWPTGSGCAKGFLSSLDCAWMLRGWSSGRGVGEVLAERESIYRLLNHSNAENLNSDYEKYTLDPISRYKHLNLHLVTPSQISHLIDSDNYTPPQLSEHDKLKQWYEKEMSAFSIRLERVEQMLEIENGLLSIIKKYRPELCELIAYADENVPPISKIDFLNSLSFNIIEREFKLPSLKLNSGEHEENRVKTLVYLREFYKIFYGQIPQARFEPGEELEELKARESLKPTRHAAFVVRNPMTGRVVRKSRNVHHGGLNSTPGSTEGGGEEAPKSRKRKSSSRISLGRDYKGTYAAHLQLEKNNVVGITKYLEEQMRSPRLGPDKKPKDLKRAIGRLDNSDWNVVAIEKKIHESMIPIPMAQDAIEKVPKWSREAYNDKLDAVKRKIEGKDISEDKNAEFNANLKKLTTTLKEGNNLDVGKRGANRVASIIEGKLIKKETENGTVAKSNQKTNNTKNLFGHSGTSEDCFFCLKRVYVMEAVSADGKSFHRNCFRCHFCRCPLRIGTYVFDKEGTDKFYCVTHYNHVKLYGNRKNDDISNVPDGGAHHQMKEDESESPVHFESSAEFDSDDDILSQIDEDEWTDRNFGSAVENNTSDDEASDLSDDDDELTPEGAKEGDCLLAPILEKDRASSESDTEVGSGDDEASSSLEELHHFSPFDPYNEEEEDENENEEEEEEDEEEEEECGGSTTEIETDSEFAEDPPHSVPGGAIVPTIVVEEPETIVTRLYEDSGLRASLPHHNNIGNATNAPPAKKHVNRYLVRKDPPPPVYAELKTDEVRVIVPESTRVQPRVHAVPKKWEPLDIGGASQALKKEYFHGNSSILAENNTKKVEVPSNGPNANTKRFSSVLDMISEQQKRLQPAPNPSPAMQAFLAGTEKLAKNTFAHSHNLNFMTRGEGNDGILGNETSRDEVMRDIERKTEEEEGLSHLHSANLLNSSISRPTEEEEGDTKNGSSSSSLLTPSGASTIVGIGRRSEEESGSETECLWADEEIEEEECGGNEEGIDEEEEEEEGNNEEKRRRKPPRVEIEDEFGVTLALDLEEEGGGKKRESFTGGGGVSDVKVSGMSSSDSKDSLNSYLYLESEMSDWSETPAPVSHLNNNANNANAQNTPHKSLHFDTLEFMDLEGTSESESELGKKRDEEVLSVCSFSEKESSRASTPLLENNEENEENLENNSTLQTELDKNIDIERNLEENLDIHKNLEENCDIGVVEAINEHATVVLLPNHKISRKSPENLVLSDRVVPFSNVRDSLDYRKVKGISSPTKARDSFFSFLSSKKEGKKSTPLTPVNSPSNYEIISPSSDTLTVETPPSKVGEEMSRSSTSPQTSRKLEEMSRERAKESDLIRSLVLGRIRKSPEKNRRGSRGSLSPHSSSTSVSTASDPPNNSKNSSNLHNISSPPKLSLLQNSEKFEGDDKTWFKTPSSDLLAPKTGKKVAENEKNSESEDENGKIPPFYRSLPNLSSPNSTRKRVSKGNSFSLAPSWDKKSILGDREKARAAARQRARLKSDEELGLNFSNEIFREKLRRKNSIVEDEVFETGNIPNIKSEPCSTLHSPLEFQLRSLQEDLTEKNDSVAASIRHNVDFPIHKNPLSTSPPEELGSKIGRHYKKLPLSPLRDNNIFPAQNESTKDSKDSDSFCKNDEKRESPMKLSQDEEEFSQIELHLKTEESSKNKLNYDLKREESPKDHHYSLQGEDSKNFNFGHQEESVKNSNSSSLREEESKKVLNFGWDGSPVVPTSFPNYFTSFSPGGSRPKSELNLSSDEAWSSSGEVGSSLSSNLTNNCMKSGPKLTLPKLHSLHSPHNNNKSPNRAMSTEALSSTSFASYPNGSSSSSGKNKKSRERRRSLIQAVSEFFINRSFGEKESEKSSSSSSASSSSQKFSLLSKISPKSLLNKAEKRGGGKSGSPKGGGGGGNFLSYLSQPELVIQNLSASPVPFKSSRANGLNGGRDESNNIGVNGSNKTTFSPPIPLFTSPTPMGRREIFRTDGKRRREIQEIEEQLESIESDQRSLETRGVSLERKLRGEEPDEGRGVSDLMEEWFTLVREKTRLSRYERELEVRVKELELEEREERVGNEFTKITHIPDKEKCSQVQEREIELFRELKNIEVERESLLSQFHEDMQKYESEDADLEAKIASSSISPMESDV